MLGKLENVSIGGMLRFLMVYEQTGSLKVSGQDREGEIFLRDGRLVGTNHTHGKLRHEVLKLLLLHKGTFSFTMLKEIPGEYCQGEEEIEDVILEASRCSEPAEITEYLPPGETVLQWATVHGGPRQLNLKLRRDEWNLLTKFNGEDSLEAVFNHSGLPKRRAQQIVYGLLSAGLIRKTRFQISRMLKIANQELGDMGEFLVWQAFGKSKLDRSCIRMPDFIKLLKEVEQNSKLLVGPAQGGGIIKAIWDGMTRKILPGRGGHNHRIGNKGDRDEKTQNYDSG